jgi:hypothetical protein
MYYIAHSTNGVMLNIESIKNVIVKLKRRDQLGYTGLDVSKDNIKLCHKEIGVTVADCIQLA